MNPLTILMKTFDSGVIFSKSLSNFVYIGIILLSKNNLILKYRREGNIGKHTLSYNG